MGFFGVITNPTYTWRILPVIVSSIGPGPPIYKPWRFGRLGRPQATTRISLKDLEITMGQLPTYPRCLILQGPRNHRSNPRARGFPGECGPDNLVEEQWNSIPVDAGQGVYVLAWSCCFFNGKELFVATKIEWHNQPWWRCLYKNIFFPLKETFN